VAMLLVVARHPADAFFGVLEHIFRALKFLSFAYVPVVVHLHDAVISRGEVARSVFVKGIVRMLRADPKLALLIDACGKDLLLLPIEPLEVSYSAHVVVRIRDDAPIGIDVIGILWVG